MTIEDKTLSELEKELGKPLAVQTERVSSDLTKLYGKKDYSSPYQDYIGKKYKKLFGKEKQFSDYAISDYLESAETEAVRNSAEHGNKGYINKKVSITRKFYPDKVLVIVEDEGKGFDYDEVIDKNLEILNQAIRKNKVSPDDIDSLPFFSTRRKKFLSRLFKKSDSSEGGQGFKRFLVDSEGDFNFEEKGKRFFYVLNLPNGYRLTQEDVNRLNGTTFSDFLSK